MSNGYAVAHPPRYKMEGEIHRVIKTTYTGLIVQVIVIFGLGLFVLIENGIELNTILVALGVIVYFTYVLPRHLRIIELGKAILRAPENFSEEQKNEFIDVARYNVQQKMLGGSNKKLKLLTGILLAMVLWFGYLFLKYN